MYLCIVDINFNNKPAFLDKSKANAFLSKIENDYNCTLGQFDFHFVTAKEMLSINEKHLNHDTHTDVITFDYSSELIEGEAFICIDRAKENALIYSQSIENELYRLLIHSVLHCCGVTDKTEKDKLNFREIEDTYLSMFHVKP